MSSNIPEHIVKEQVIANLIFEIKDIESTIVEVAKERAIAESKSEDIYYHDRYIDNLMKDMKFKTQLLLDIRITEQDYFKNEDYRLKS